MAEHLALAGTLASATSAALEIASTIVKIVHDLTRDAISQIAGTAIYAAAATAVTVGIAAPAAIAAVAARVSALLPRVVRAIEAVIRSFEKLGPLLAKVDEIYFTLQRLLDRLLPGYHGPSGQHAAVHGPPWELAHPQNQHVLDDLQAAAANGPPGYDPTGGLGWQRFMDEYYLGLDSHGNPKWNWPPDPPHTNGFLNGSGAPTTLRPGDTFDRITFLDEKGDPIDGKFGAPPGSEFSTLALPPNRLADNATTLRYEVLKPLPPGVEEGLVAPGFEQPGMGTQYYFPNGIESLIGDGYVRVVP